MKIKTEATTNNITIFAVYYNIFNFYFVTTFFGLLNNPQDNYEIQFAHNINSRQKWIISMLRKNGRITTKEISSKFKKISIKTIKRDLFDLKNKKIIEFIGSLKTGYYCFVDAVNDTKKSKKVIKK